MINIYFSSFFLVLNDMSADSATVDICKISGLTVRVMSVKRAESIFCFNNMHYPQVCDEFSVSKQGVQTPTQKTSRDSFVIKFHKISYPCIYFVWLYLNDSFNISECWFFFLKLRVTSTSKKSKISWSRVYSHFLQLSIAVIPSTWLEMTTVHM